MLFSEKKGKGNHMEIPTKKKLNLALILSGGIFPGSGQFYLKRHLQGIVISVSVSGATLIGLWGYIHSLQEIMSRNQVVLTSHFITIATIIRAFNDIKIMLILCTFIVFFGWLYGIFDIIFLMAHSKDSTPLSSPDS